MEELINRIAKAPLAARIGGVAGMVVLVTLLNYFLFVSPEEDRITQQIQSQQTLDRQMSEKQEISQNLTERRRELEIKEQQLAEALAELPEQSDVDELLAQLNDVGKKSGLEIARVEPGKETPESFYAKIPIKMQVSGNFHEIAMFLQEVSTMKRIVNVNNIKLSSPATRNEKVVLSSEFLATTFRFLDPALKGADNKAKVQ